MNNRTSSRPAFTIVELMVAMAVSLLLMAALAKAFGYIGQTMKEGRAEVDLSARLRAVTYRLNDELARCTAEMDPSNLDKSRNGYLVYYDGPHSDSTAVRFSREYNEVAPAAVEALREDPSYLAIGRYGDFDDYLAFTAVAAEGSHFTGVVPRYVLEANGALIKDSTWDPHDFPTLSLEPVVTTSKYAEIVYWTQPEYAADGTILDADADGMPDRLRLHRRVLLIRPDLNLQLGRTGTPAYQRGELPWLVVPAGSTDGWRQEDLGKNHMRLGAIPGGLPPYDVAGVVSQWDLSVSRVLNENGSDSLRLKANSLEDLELPHNRFAHVRFIPSTISGNLAAGRDVRTMPLLDLQGVPSSRGKANTNPFLYSRRPGGNASLKTAREVEQTSGFLNWSYNLSRSDRIGEDIVVGNLLAFDIRVYDPLAPMVIYSGGDGRPGSTGVVTAGAYGQQGSDDVVVTPSDIGFGKVMSLPFTPSANYVANGPVASGQAIVMGRGAFVDLDYVRKAGGSTQMGWGLPLSPNVAMWCSGGFSGFDVSATAAKHFIPESLRRSGKVIDLSPNLTPPLYQPTFDTWTASYEADGFNQRDFYQVSGGSDVGTVWEANAPALATSDIIEGGNGVDNPPAGSPPSPSGNGVIDDPDERATMPPFPFPLEAISVRVRLEDRTTGAVREMETIRHFK